VRWGVVVVVVVVAGVVGVAEVDNGVASQPTRLSRSSGTKRSRP
jgi:hypothetical protein